MSQTTRSAISTLPNELLLHIFRHVSVITPRFPWNKSPLLLSHVCILWRNLILATSSLWSDIDLHHLSMAKHRLALARDQPLDIIWFRSDDNSTSLEQYEWVSSFAARIVTLRLVLPSAGAVDLFNRVGKELSQLRELIASAGFRHMNPLQLAHMPNLRVLSISDYMLDGANLMEVLRNSVMLMKLKLVSINIPRETLDSVGSIALPRLRSFELVSDDPATLHSLITSVALPTGPGLHLEIMEYVSYNRSPLHASIIAAIETIRITTIRLDERFITFAESTNKKRCTISLRVGLGRDGYLELIPPYPDLTSVTTVDVLHPESIMPRLPTNPSVLDLLTRILSSVSELIVHSAALWTSAEGDSSQWLQKFLPASQLKVLTLQDVNLDADTDSGLKNIQIISGFATEMLSKEQVALSKLVLRNCETDRQGISILRAILPVEVTY